MKTTKDETGCASGHPQQRQGQKKKKFAPSGIGTLKPEAEWDAEIKHTARSCGHYPAPHYPPLHRL